MTRPPLHVRHQRGFTLIELCIGMMVTGFVATVLAGFTATMSHQWRHAETQQHLDVTSQQGCRILRPIVQSARAVGHVFASPSPAVFLWQNDDLDRSNVAQFGEMTLIEYDSATETISFYQPDPDFGLAGDSMACKAVTPAEMANYTVVQLFKSQAWLKPTRVILGPGTTQTDHAALTRVTACTFGTPAGSGATGELPVIAFDATLERGDQALAVHDRFAVRVPTVPTVVSTNTVTGN